MKKLVAAIVLTLAVFGAASMGLAIGDRQPPVRFDGVRVLTTHVAPGQDLEIEYSLHRYRFCDVTGRRWLTDASGTTFAISTYTRGDAPDLGPESYRRAITVPESAVPGPATYFIELAYTCNLIHRLGWPIRVSSPPAHFDIVERPDMGGA
ncbi:MAG: hypothetical protein J0H18_11230 [Rhizobiales bacterium]|nr:hypothetical protein [Hyphomicrobiales bacterium]OJY06697.1 MAG: hypothetical protein BGP07_16800 [Rhizobiales bacterium 63-22]